MYSLESKEVQLLSLRDGRGVLSILHNFREFVVGGVCMCLLYWKGYLEGKTW